MDMESIYHGFENTRAKRFIEEVLSAAFPVRNGSNRAACFRPWWAHVRTTNLDPFRPFERGDEGAKPSKEGSFETPKQRRSRSLMSADDRDMHRQADAARRQETERNHRSLGTTPASSQELERSLKRFEGFSLGT